MHYEVRPNETSGYSSAIDPRAEAVGVLPNVAFGIEGHTSFIREKDNYTP